MDSLETTFDALDGDHPLKNHEEWIRNAWEARNIPEKQPIPSPTADPVRQAFSIFCSIRYIARVRNWKLFEGALAMAAAENSFALAQIVRASFENAGWLGHACHLTREWPPISQCEQLKNLLVGTRSDGDDLPSVNILTCLDNTDKVLRKVLPEKTEWGNLIKNYHGLVSEFVHPNFASNFSEIEIEGHDSNLKLSSEKARSAVAKLLSRLRFAGFACEQLSMIADARIESCLK